jgi:hypothetical protein
MLEFLIELRAFALAAIHACMSLFAVAIAVGFFIRQTRINRFQKPIPIAVAIATAIGIRYSSIVWRIS